MPSPSTPSLPSSGSWPSTLWGLVDDARRPGTALEKLLELYYPPVRRFFERALGVAGADLDDVVQDFFTRFLERDFLRNLRYERSFRGFLKVACRRHYLNWRRGEGRRPRPTLLADGPDEAPLPAERTSQILEEEVRREYVDEALRRASRELEAAGRGLQFRILERRAGLDGSPGADYETLAREFRLRVYEVRNHLAAARRVFRRILLELVAQRTADPAGELRELGLFRFFR